MFCTFISIAFQIIFHVYYIIIQVPNEMCMTEIGVEG